MVEAGLIANTPLASSDESNGGLSVDTDIVGLLRRLLPVVNQRTAQSCDEMFSFAELPEFSMALATVEDGSKASAKVPHLQRQLTTALHQHFRKRWPTSIPDWSPEEKRRGLDRPTGNRTQSGHTLDLSSLGVQYINAAVVAWRPIAIVMLNGMPSAEDTNDLAPYWLPSSLPENSLSLAAVEEEYHDAAADCLVRMLRCKLHDLEWSGPQLVVSWWRDQSEPPLCKFLALCQLVNRLLLRSVPAPIVVHCAGGIGRAGVFIGADCAARGAAMGADLERCSPDRLVAHLRQCRQNMVQTAEQYEFLHRVLPRLTTQMASDMAASAERSPSQ
eukprot:CAMPEP_0169080188 /NCGR_PEP_ID=MMETSP1015-20121227/10346_1 /TAXON_ID=342587 /ORGANISM="Karlodinium micrum, Strain CCMP2283" /LENGTH=330 /DNA_ID=CAMNT_0009139897 /DNA_START=37 /DNA_END=1025 /DNA_ORIENTATION=+